MAEMRSAARKPQIIQNHNATTTNEMMGVVGPTRRVRRRHHTSGTSSRLRKQRSMYKMLFFICLGFTFVAFVHIYNTRRPDSMLFGVDDIELDVYTRKKMRDRMGMMRQGDDSIANLRPAKPEDENDMVLRYNPYGMMTGGKEHPDYPKTDAEKEHLILEGRVHLININIDLKKLIKPGGYEGVLGHFCFLDWQKYRDDPSSYPMFRDIEHYDCHRRSVFTYDLHKVVRLATLYDQTNVTAIEPSGFIFHESRCGSTLVANALTAMNPDEHIVYSESQPPLQALKACGMRGESCPKYRAAELFQDVVYMMGRTREPSSRKKLFFKIQSVGTKYLDVALESFPETPWIFVYRDPVQIMMSQFQRGKHAAICVRQLINVDNKSMEFLTSIGKKINKLNPYEKCAFHLSILCATAIKAIENSNGMGRGVNYEDLSNKLIDDIFPNHFQLEMTEKHKERIIEVSSHYSKGRGKRKGLEWVEDSEEKEEMATPKIKEACETFLYPIYNTLENGV